MICVIYYTSKQGINLILDGYIQG